MAMQVVLEKDYIMDANKAIFVSGIAKAD